MLYDCLQSECYYTISYIHSESEMRWLYSLYCKFRQLSNFPLINLEFVSSGVESENLWLVSVQNVTALRYSVVDS